MARRPELFSLRGMLELSKELGLTGIDFVTLHDTPPAELRRMAEDYGLTIACHTFMADLNHPEAAGRRAGVDAAKRGIDAAVALGADTVMIPTAGPPEMPRAQTRRNIIAGLQEIVGFATRAGITLTVENFPGASSPFVIAADLREAQAAVPELRFTFDSGNAAQGEDPAASFTRCADAVVHAHFKDWVTTTPEDGHPGLDGRYYRAALIGQGIVAYPALLAAMHRAGYAGYIDIEYEGHALTPEQAVRQAVAYLRGQMAALGIPEG